MTADPDAIEAFDPSSTTDDNGDGFDLDETPSTGLPEQTDLLGHLVAIRPIYWRQHEGNGGFRGLHCQVIDVDDDSGAPVFYDDMLVTWSTVVNQLIGRDNDPDDHPSADDEPLTKWRAGVVTKQGAKRNAPVRLDNPNPSGAKRIKDAGAAWKRGELRTIKRPKFDNG